MQYPAFKIDGAIRGAFQPLRGRGNERGMRILNTFSGFEALGAQVRGTRYVAGAIPAAWGNHCDLTQLYRGLASIPHHKQWSIQRCWAYRLDKSSQVGVL